MLTCTCSAQYVAMDLLQSLGCHGPARPVGWHGPPATCTPAQLSTLSRKCSALWADLDLLGSVGSLLGSVHYHGPAQLSRLTRTCSVHCVAVDVLSSFGCHGSARLNRSRAGKLSTLSRAGKLSTLPWTCFTLWFGMLSSVYVAMTWACSVQYVPRGRARLFGRH